MSDTQNEAQKGWSWFEREAPLDVDKNASTDLPDPGRELRIAYARCFAGPDGEKVMAHLRALTLDRAFGPDTDNQTLRHMEGQRQLVAYITAQFDRGRSGT